MKLEVRKKDCDICVCIFKIFKIYCENEYNIFGDGLCITEKEKNKVREDSQI